MRKYTIIKRWSLVSSLLIALFWAMYYQFAGKIPAVSGEALPGWSFILPLAISRLWDVLIGPIWSATGVIIIFKFNAVENTAKYGHATSAVAVMTWFISLVISLITGILNGLTSILISGVVVALVALIELALAKRMVPRFWIWLNDLKPITNAG